VEIGHGRQATAIARSRQAAIGRNPLEGTVRNHREAGIAHSPRAATARNRRVQEIGLSLPAETDRSRQATAIGLHKTPDPRHVPILSKEITAIKLPPIPSRGIDPQR
jgi:hypothetical protein